MKMRLLIIDNDYYFNWELSTQGIIIAKDWDYSTAEKAEKAAKNVAKQLNITISKCTYHNTKDE